ncbi:MAG: CsbD family protein [Bacteriovoracaceae bacterium]
MLNKDVLLGKWVEVKGELRKKWGDLTDDELEKAKGNLNALAGLLQQKLGISKEEAMKKLEGTLGQAAMKGLELKGTLEDQAKKGFQTGMKTANLFLDEVKSKLKK